MSHGRRLLNGNLHGKRRLAVLFVIQHLPWSEFVYVPVPRVRKPVNGVERISWRTKGINITNTSCGLITSDGSSLVYPRGHY